MVGSSHTSLFHLVHNHVCPITDMQLQLRYLQYYWIPMPYHAPFSGFPLILNSLKLISLIEEITNYFFFQKKFA